MLLPGFDAYVLMLTSLTFQQLISGHKCITVQGYILIFKRNDYNGNTSEQQMHWLFAFLQVYFS